MRKFGRWMFVSICLVVVIIFFYAQIDNTSGILLDNWVYSNLVIITPFWTAYFKFMTFWAEPITIVILCMMTLITLIFKKRSSLYLIGFLIISTVINQILKYLVARPRPDLALIEVSGHSFPSGHAMGAVSFYGFIIWLVFRSKLNNKIKVVVNGILTFLIINICYSRIYLGVHYFSDVLSGALISLSLLLISTYYIKKYQKEGI